MEIEISCPHCKKEFVSKNAVPAILDQPKLHKMTSGDTFCPYCNGQYVFDITPLCAILFITVCLLILGFMWAGHDLIAISIGAAAYFVFINKKNVFTKVSQK